jgi:hypothetical protein
MVAMKAFLSRFQGFRLFSTSNPGLRLDVVSKFDGTGFQPLISLPDCETQGFALGWYGGALSALNLLH